MPAGQGAAEYDRGVPQMPKTDLGAMPLWTFPELTAALGLPAAHGPGITGVAIDSRRLERGDLFVALSGDPGPRFRPSSRSARDGHDFVADAIRKGAAAVLAHRRGDYAAPALLVDDTLDGLWALGRARRSALEAPVVAVTGSSGKTTFKSFAATALGAFATAGSLNNHIGVPLSLALTPRDAAGAVCEIGTNHPGEIAPLAQLASPDVAVVLNVGPAHIEHFGSLEAIRREKTSIAVGLEADGVLVRPAVLAANYAGRTVTFGKEESADVRLLSVAAGRAEFQVGRDLLNCPVPGGGAHRAMSVCAVAAVLLALGRPMAHLQRLAHHAVPRGRGNRLRIGTVSIVDESYNANPASMAATLVAFGEEPAKRRVAILGDMLELGADASRYHAEIGAHCGPLDGVFCVGERMAALYETLPRRQRLGFAAQTDGDLARRCAALLQPGDVVLVKGSNGVFWVHDFVAALAQELGS